MSNKMKDAHKLKENDQDSRYYGGGGQSSPRERKTPVFEYIVFAVIGLVIGLIISNLV